MFRTFHEIILYFLNNFSDGLWLQSTTVNPPPDFSPNRSPDPLKYSNKTQNFFPLTISSEEKKHVWIRRIFDVFKITRFLSYTIYATFLISPLVFTPIRPPLPRLNTTSIKLWRHPRQGSGNFSFPLHKIHSCFTVGTKSHTNTRYAPLTHIPVQA